MATMRVQQNPVSSAVSGGTIPSGNIITEFQKYVTAREPRMTPLLSRIGYGPAYDIRPLRVGAHKRVAMSSTLAAAATNVATSVSVAASTGVIYQKYAVVRVVDYIVGTTRLDDTTTEIMWLSGDPAADTLTVARGQGGTTARAHTAGALVELIGTAEPFNQFHTISPVERGVQAYNEFQRFAGSVFADEAVRNMRTHEHKSDSLKMDFEEEVLRQKLLLEMALWHGGRQAGQPDTPSPSLMGGLTSQILTNVTDVGGATLSPYTLESEVRDLWKTVDQSAAKVLAMSIDTAAIWDSLIMPLRQLNASDDTLNFVTEKVKFRSGTYDIAVSRFCPDGMIFILDFAYLKVIPFKGLNWHPTTHVTNADHSQLSFSGDFTLRVESENTMAIIKNFNTNLDAYPGRSYLG